MPEPTIIHRGVEDAMSIHGTCLCRGIEYEIAASPVQAGHCHCSKCRTWGGSAFLSYAGFPMRDFRWIKGEDLLGRFPSSSEVFRIFCTRCGSSLAAWPSDPAGEFVWIMMGTLDGDPGLKPSAHIFVGSKAPWFDIADGLPQHAEFPA
jgi:hypothetical protein